jgi:hypothetical protein
LEGRVVLRQKKEERKIEQNLEMEEFARRRKVRREVEERMGEGDVIWVIEFGLKGSST